MDTAALPECVVGIMSLVANCKFNYFVAQMITHDHARMLHAETSATFVRPDDLQKDNWASSLEVISA